MKSNPNRLIHADNNIPAPCAGCARRSADCGSCADFDIWDNFNGQQKRSNVWWAATAQVKRGEQAMREYGHLITDAFQEDADEIAPAPLEFPNRTSATAPIKLCHLLLEVA